MTKTDPFPPLERVSLKPDDPCPKCDVGFVELHRHRFSTERGPNLPDCSWLECCECGFKTDPE